MSSVAMLQLYLHMIKSEMSVVNVDGGRPITIEILALKPSRLKNHTID